MWIAWGIVQAKVAGMNEALRARKRSVEPMKLDSDPLSQEVPDLAKDVQDKRPENWGPEAANEDEDEIAEEEEEFDYLGYSQDRAMFFWGDVLQLGIVKREGLPQELLEKIKIVEY